jgi:hypothetical protein
MAALNQLLSYSVAEWELIEIATEAALGGVDVRIATNMLYEPWPLIVARPVRPEDFVAINNSTLLPAWLPEEDELDLLAQQPAVQTQLMLAPGE